MSATELALATGTDVPFADLVDVTAQARRSGSVEVLLAPARHRAVTRVRHLVRACPRRGGAT